MIRHSTIAAALLLAAQAAPTRADTLEQAAKVFGARESVLHVSLSPSGDKIAYVAPYGTGGEAVFVVDLAKNPKPLPILSNNGEQTRIVSCKWATDDRLVCNTHVVAEDAGVLLGFTRLVAVGSDGSDVDVLTRSLSDRALGINQRGGTILALDLAGKPDKILMTRQWVPERTTGTNLANEASGLGVEEVDIDTQSTRRVEIPYRDAVDYIADEKGRVRLMVRQQMDASGNIGGKQSYWYRAAASDTWRELGKADVFEGSGFIPVAVDSARDVVFGFDRGSGFTALDEIALDGSGQRKRVLARNDVDIDELVRIGRRNRVVGASYATEKRQVEYFDPELARLAASLGDALAGKPLVSIVDASHDEGKLLLIASSDTDPGMIYLYDKAKRELAELLPMRDPLVGKAMGAMKPVSFPAADGTVIPGYLTLPPGMSEAKGLPAVVLPHGGPGARDEWGFDWMVQFLAGQGYAVLQPNFRGSSGYGTAWFGRNGFQMWRTAIGDVNDAGRWLVGQGIADPKQLAVAGWSYGGYAALQSQVLDPQLFKAVVAIAPVTDLEQLRDEHRAFVTHGLVDRFIGRGEHVKAGSPAQNAEAFAAPVLLFHGTADQNVGYRQSRLMQRRLESAGKRVSYVEFDKLDHSLSDSAARARMLTEMARFLKASMAR